MSKIWQTITCENGKTHFFSIAQLQCWLKVYNDEVWITYVHDEDYLTKEKDSMSPEPPENISWARWALKKNVSQLQVVPVLADAPLMVHSEYALKIAAGARIRIYTRVPVWVRIQTAEKNPVVIHEIPSVINSKTWFGSRDEGEICYAMSTKARRKLPEETYKPYLINSAITIQNRSDEYLDFEKFCFRVEQLDVYQKEEQFWTNETHIVYRGADHISEVNISDKIPEEARGAKKITAARKKADKGLAKRTFYKLVNEIKTIGR